MWLQKPVLMEQGLESSFWNSHFQTSILCELHITLFILIKSIFYHALLLYTWSFLHLDNLQWLLSTPRGQTI